MEIGFYTPASGVSEFGNLMLSKLRIIQKQSIGGLS